MYPGTTVYQGLMLESSCLILCMLALIATNSPCSLGESLGLVPGPDARRIHYNKAVDRPDIRPAIEDTLNHLRLLLEKAEVVTDRYELKDDVKDTRSSLSKGMTIFRETYQSFRARIRKNQK